MSLLVITLVLEMKVHSVSSLLVASAVVHMTLMLVSFWLGALSSGFLIQAAEVIGGVGLGLLQFVVGGLLLRV